ncbi:DUF1428 domain-containing protein [Falsigemmobacter faecalis]|uniref:DUF1428 domain-containing protein n=1 Tax=Falsigemmobacter faecalis TaxID=2488730 RepID=A0A3P3DAV6_9RHOB|nr:DUF1428 domain-containing protein [Falsigemmobacter faecalis]RRH71479.1 DUF1428 domain-containing protein [Falsigemmobacter faecalis]
MNCYTGSLIAVPLTSRAAYLELSRASWPLIRKQGARRIVEAWGVDIPKGKINDLPGAVQATEEEAVAFSFVEWPDAATAATAWEAMAADPAMAALPEMPFDGSRMIMGTFEAILTAGTDRGMGWLQGFVLAVPESAKARYTALARRVWEEEFRPNGCLGTVETWGRDVPHGQKTDFWRATLARPGEVPLFSWTAWADRETCDAATSAMSSGNGEERYGEMPFDPQRMIWGGFEVIYDSDRG